MWHWLLTSTTYGTWLPGDARGSIASVRDRRVGDQPSQMRVEHDRPGEAWEPPMPALRQSCEELLIGEPVWLTSEHATVLLNQFLESASYRSWRLFAASVMRNHFHLVVQVDADIPPEKLLQTFKAYGSRALNERFCKPMSGTWWTKSGSKRKLGNEQAVLAAVNYVLHKQPHPLVTWPTRLTRIDGAPTNRGEPAT